MPLSSRRPSAVLAADPLLIPSAPRRPALVVPRTLAVVRASVADARCQLRLRNLQLRLRNLTIGKLCTKVCVVGAHLSS